MKRIILILLLALTAALPSACKKPDYNGPCHCQTDNPLTNLRWLRHKVQQLEQSPWCTYISICQYDGGQDGFLICEADGPDAGLNLYDCQGNYQGTLWGFAGLGYDDLKIDPATILTIYDNGVSGIVLHK